MKAVIVDDEKKGREILKKFIETYCSQVQVCGLAANADEAYDLIQQNTPEIVFLDIQMPNGDGFDLLERFTSIHFHLIFVTAHDHYAIKAIRHYALDYLLKPIDINELRRAVQRAMDMPRPKASENRYAGLVASRRVKYSGRITVPVKEGMIYLSVSDIIHIESDLGCSVIYTVDGKKYVVAKNLVEFADILPESDFFRIHKSHLINTHMVKKYIRTDGLFVEMSDGSRVEVARRKKEEFLKFMDEMG